MSEQASAVRRDWLQKIEYIGNKLPDITMLFVYALIICWLLSWGLSYFSFDYINPVTKQPLAIVNLFQPSEIIAFFTALTKNFVNFPRWGLRLSPRSVLGLPKRAVLLMLD